MAFMFMAMACVPQVLATGEIQVTYPNGGESIDASIGRIDVRWESSLTGEVDIYIVKGLEEKFWIMGNAEASQGSASLPLPVYLHNGNDYRVKIESGDYIDYSDGYFSVTGNPSRDDILSSWWTYVIIFSIILVALVAIIWIVYPPLKTGPKKHKK